MEGREIAVGNHIGNLTIIEYLGHTRIIGNHKEKDSLGTYYWCKCDCGNFICLRREFLRTGKDLSCGCSKPRRKGVKKGKLKNKYVFKGNLVYLYVKNREKPTIIDKEDYERIKDYYWCSVTGGYTYSSHYENYNQTTIALHRLLLGVTDRNIQVDHINRNVLDNRKCNLRLVNCFQNSLNKKLSSRNSSGVKGVSKTKSNKWKAYITKNKKPVNLGTFENFEDAVKARKEAEIIYFGEDIKYLLN